VRSSRIAVIFAGLAAALAVVDGCGASSTSGASSIENEGGPVGYEAGPDGGGDASVGSTSDPCAAGTPVPTQSPTLDAWPVLAVATGVDRTAAAHVTSVAVPGPPAGIQIAKSGDWVFAALGPKAQGQLGLLKRSGATLTWDHGVAMPANALPFGLAQSDDGALVAVGAGTQVVLVDAAKAKANDAAATVAAVPNHSAQGTTIDVKLSRDGKFAFAALEFDGGVAVIDVAAKSYVGTIPLAANGVTGIALSPDGARLYVVSEAATEFSKANPSPQQDQIIGSVTVIDAALATTNPAGSVLGHAFVGRAPVRLALSADGATLWVTLRGSNAVVALSTERLLSTTCTPVLATVAVGPAPVGLTLIRGGTAVAITSSNRFAAPADNQTVTFVNVARALSGAPDALVGQVTVGAFPREVAADGDALFVSNFNSSTLSGIDLSGLTFER
jgi:DNA-binding beta-propeller fold protein YncE